MIDTSQVTKLQTTVQKRGEREESQRRKMSAMEACLGGGVGGKLGKQMAGNVL